MRRWAILLVFCAGCSTAPIADVLDYFKPGHIEPGKTPPYGGVCQPSPVSAPTGPPIGVPQATQGGPMLPLVPASPAPGAPANVPGSGLPAPVYPPL